MSHTSSGGRLFLCICKFWKGYSQLWCSYETSYNLADYALHKVYKAFISMSHFWIFLIFLSPEIPDPIMILKSWKKLLQVAQFWIWKPISCFTLQPFVSLAWVSTHLTSLKMLCNSCYTEVEVSILFMLSHQPTPQGWPNRCQYGYSISSSY